jgi:RNA polymerase sigma factor (sigma-70 family)
VSHEHAISLYQPMLQAIAMRFLGSVSDAEDMVQDTFLKWLTIDAAHIRNTKSYLIKTVTNNCLNHIENLNRKKTEWIDALPQFLTDKWETNIDFDKELSHALEIIHQKLEPVERGIFLMREVFNLEYEEIQEIFEKKKEHCRQLLHRAKKKLGKESSASASDSPPVTFIQSFRNACQHGYLQELILDIKGEIK